MKDRGLVKKKLRLIKQQSLEIKMLNVHIYEINLFTA